MLVDDNAAPLINDGKPAEEKQPLLDRHFVSAVLTIVNAALGAGVLAYPYAFMSAGQLVGTLVSIGMGVLRYGSGSTHSHQASSPSNPPPPHGSPWQLRRTLLNHARNGNR